jgi:hypothetical protein
VPANRAASQSVLLVRKAGDGRSVEAVYVKALNTTLYLDSSLHGSHVRMDQVTATFALNPNHIALPGEDAHGSLPSQNEVCSLTRSRIPALSPCSRSCHLPSICRNN